MGFITQFQCTSHTIEDIRNDLLYNIPKKIIINAFPLFASKVERKWKANLHLNSIT